MRAEQALQKVSVRTPHLMRGTKQSFRNHQGSNDFQMTHIECALVLNPLKIKPL